MSDEKPKKHALNNPKIMLTAPCPTASGKVSQLRWDVYMNNPRIIVRTNDPALLNKENGFGNIQAAMDAPLFYAFLELIKAAYESPVEWKDRIQNSNFEGEHTSDVWVGKDKEGCIYLSVVAKKEDRPVIKFIFGLADTRFHSLIHGDGTPYTRAELSVLYAKAYYKLLSETMSNILVQEYVEPPPYVPKGKGNYQNNNQSTKPNPPTSGPLTDDDFPF